MKKALTGIVVSNKAKDTAIIEVTVWKTHPIFKKRFKRTKRYLAHNPGNTFEEGKEVEIVSTRPISKRKHWIAQEIKVKGTKGKK